MGEISLWTKSFLEKSPYKFQFEEIATSSNDLAKKRAFKKEGDQACLFLVDKQTKGRGYENKVWQNSDLMLSFLWEKESLDVQPNSCKSFAEDLKKALEKTWSRLPVFVKEPNDLYLEKAKCAGILLEFLKQGTKTALIIGLGMNVFSNPKNLNTACLSKHIQNINTDKWFLFLELLLSYWFKRAKFLSKLQ